MARNRSTDSSPDRPARRLEDEITLLRNKLLSMVDTVDEQCGDAITALLERDTELATQVIERDDEIDQMELAIDGICERILALHQPVAVDLRLIITAIKGNTDLERIGDHCKNLAKGTGHLTRYRNVLPETYIEEMAESVRSMLRTALAAWMASSPSSLKAASAATTTSTTSAEAARRLAQVGENRVARAETRSPLRSSAPSRRRSATSLPFDGVA